MSSNVSEVTPLPSDAHGDRPFRVLVLATQDSPSHSHQAVADTSPFGEHRDVVPDDRNRRCRPWTTCASSRRTPARTASLLHRDVRSAAREKGDNHASKVKGVEPWDERDAVKVEHASAGDPLNVAGLRA